MTTVAVLGASPKPDRYSHLAVKMLLEGGHTVIPVHPRETTILGQPCKQTLSAITEMIDTVTVYLKAKNSDALIDELVKLHPRRVILNPGAENPALMERLRAAGVEVVEACTLVLLRTQQF